MGLPRWGSRSVRRQRLRNLDGILERVDPEVDHLGRPALAEDDVGRLEITVNQALVVAAREGLRHLLGDLERALGRDRAGGHEIDQAFAVDELDRDEFAVPAGLHRTHVADVAVPQGRRCSRLRDEPLVALGVRQDGERYLTPPALVASAVEAAQAAVSDLANDLVMRECLADHSQNGWHCRWPRGGVKRLAPIISGIEAVPRAEGTE